MQTAAAYRVPRPPQGPRPAFGRWFVGLVGLAALCGMFALVLTHRGPSMAFGVLAAPVVAWAVLRWRSMGLLLAAALLLALPYWTRFGTAQLDLTRASSILAVVTFLLCRRPKLSLIDGLLVLWVLIVVLDWFFQYNHPHAGRVMTYELTPLGVYLGARAIPAKRLGTLMVTTVLAGAVGSLTVIYEYMQGAPVFRDPTKYGWVPGAATIFRPGGIFGSPPGAGTVLTVVVLFGFAALYHSRGRMRTLVTVCIGICVVALVLTFTRAALIAVAVGVLVFFWLMGASFVRRPIRLVWIAGVMTVLVLIALPALERNNTFQKGVLRSGLSSTLVAREGFWQLAMPITLANPHNFLFGIGTSAVETPFVSSLAPVSSDEGKAPQVYSISLQNEYVNTLLEQGVIGLAALLLLLGFAVVRTARAAYTYRDPILAAAAAGIIGLVVTMFVDSVLFHAPSFAMTMILCAIAARVPSTRALKKRARMAANLQPPRAGALELTAS